MNCSLIANSVVKLMGSVRKAETQKTTVTKVEKHARVLKNESRIFINTQKNDWFRN